MASSHVRNYNMMYLTRRKAVRYTTKKGRSKKSREVDRLGIPQAVYDEPPKMTVEEISKIDDSKFAH